MPKKGKKGPYQKRGKGSAKPPKQLTPSELQSIKEELSCVQDPAEAAGSCSRCNVELPTTSNDQVCNVQASTSQFEEQLQSTTPGIIVEKCAQIEKLAANLQKKCQVSPHTKEITPDMRDPKNVEELEFLVSEIKKLAQNVSAVTLLPEELTMPLTFYDACNVKWPRNKIKVPHVFVHPPVNVWDHARDIVSSNIKIFYPELGKQYAKLLCPTFGDHSQLVNYLDGKNLPYHTFGHPANKMLKVIIRGIEPDVDLDKLKEEMIAESIPVVRLHELNTKIIYKPRFMSIIVVVPASDTERKVLRIKSIFGKIVKVEPPLQKPKQCHRCQRWGHTQRYCHGQIKCVKCAGEHFSKDCTRDPTKDPLKCSNCGGEHTASYRKCSHCPDSYEYQLAQARKRKTGCVSLRELMPINCCPPKKGGVRTINKK